MVVHKIQSFEVDETDPAKAIALVKSGIIEPTKFVTFRVLTNPAKEKPPLSIMAWPMWAKALKQFATPEDTGIGDIVHRMIGEEYSAAFKAWHWATFGKTCGCKGRQATWNRLYPLK